MRQVGLLWLLFAGFTLGLSVANVAPASAAARPYRSCATLLFYAGSVLLRRWAR